MSNAEACARWRAMHPERAKAARKAWLRRHPDVVRANRRARKRRLAAWVQAQKRRPCVDCGTYYPGRMEFDHRDPMSKLFTIAPRKFSSSKTILAREIAKCDVRCWSCHRKRTGRDRSMKAALTAGRKRHRERKKNT